MLKVSPRFTAAVEYARRVHLTQQRKQTEIPYLAHLLGVASLVLEHGGDNDQAIAGMLHDAIEDGGAAHAGRIRERFGRRVASIVLACSDDTAEQKRKLRTRAEKRADWERRKRAHLVHLEAEPMAALLVSACDKLHNARAIVQDLEDPRIGRRVFARFNASREQTLGYYESLARVFRRRGVAPARQLDLTVARMHALAGARRRRPL